MRSKTIASIVALYDLSELITFLIPVQSGTLPGSKSNVIGSFVFASTININPTILLFVPDLA